MQATSTTIEAEASRALVERIQRGDSRAEQEMVERYSKGLGLMLYNRCRDNALAEDVTQDTWIIVIQKVRNKELRDNSRLAGFIIQIAKNQLLMVFRSNNKRVYVDTDEAKEVVDPAPLPEQSMINDDLGQVVSLTLSYLRKPRDKELIRRFYLIGDTKTDLCAELNLTSAHFDAVLSRARTRFKKLWKKHGQKS